MESLKSKNDIESEAEKKIKDILIKALESGDLTMEMLDDENFAQNLVNMYIELESKEKKGDVI